MPLQLPKFLELVGLGYTSWFVYRYLLFKVPPIPPIALPQQMRTVLVA